MIPLDRHIRIGTLLFDGFDQIDATGPFEVLSRLPNATHRLYGLSDRPVRDVAGLRILPDATIAEAPSLDVLHVPGGHGQEWLMDHDATLAWLRTQAGGATAVLSVCTGALLLGAAGLLVGRQATTHWSAHHLLPLFGAIAIDARVVRDGSYLFAAGVTAGIDGALRLAADLRGQAAAERIQLDIAYAPEPPFNSGTPETASAAVLSAARQSEAELIARRPSDEASGNVDGPMIRPSYAGRRMALVRIAACRPTGSSRWTSPKTSLARHGTSSAPATTTPGCWVRLSRMRAGTSKSGAMPSRCSRVSTSEVSTCRTTYSAPLYPHLRDRTLSSTADAAHSRDIALREQYFCSYTSAN